MKKILFVIPTLRDGGAERSLVNLLCELPKDVYEIDLLLFKMQGTFLPQVPKNVNILEQPTILKKLYGPIRKAGIYMPVKVVGNVLARIIKSGMGEQKAFVWEYFYKNVIDGLDKEYDVAIGYLGGETTYYIVDKVKAKRRIHWVHNDYRTSGMPKKYDLKLFSKVDAIVTISDECLQILSEEFPEFQNKCFCVANITSSTIVKQRAEEFRPKEYEKENNIILSIGRLSEQKGFDMAITAARIIKTKGIKFKWFIIGSGPLNDELSKQIQKENVADCIQLLGSRENPYPYIKECDIYVQPSRYEGKAVAVREAQILNKPVIITNFETSKSQLTDGFDGVIVPMDNEGCAEGICNLIKDKKLQQKLIENTKITDYTNKQELEKIYALLEG